jgi:prephenate dehydrogenase
MAAFALVNALDETNLDGVDLKRFCAGGFKDITRIASSRPELWRDICLLNRRALSRSLGTYIRNLERMKRWIDDRNGRALDREFGNANEVRKMLS